MSASSLLRTSTPLREGCYLAPTRLATLQSYIDKGGRRSLEKLKKMRGRREAQRDRWRRRDRQERSAAASANTRGREQQLERTYRKLPPADSASKKRVGKITERRGRSANRSRSRHRRGLTQGPAHALQQLSHVLPLLRREPLLVIVSLASHRAGAISSGLLLARLVGGTAGRGRCATSSSFGLVHRLAWWRVVDALTHHSTSAAAPSRAVSALVLCRIGEGLVIAVGYGVLGSLRMRERGQRAKGERTRRRRRTLLWRSAQVWNSRYCFQVCTRSSGTQRNTLR